MGFPVRLCALVGRFSDPRVAESVNVLIPHLLSRQIEVIISTAAILELAGSITTPEFIQFGQIGTPILTPSATGNLRSLSGDNVIDNSIALDNAGNLGVDAGSTLTITGALLDNTSGANAALRKVGAGSLTTRRAAFR